jgi:hypothetical protein
MDWPVEQDAYGQYRAVYEELRNAKERLRTSVSLMKRLEEAPPHLARALRLAFRDAASNLTLRGEREFLDEFRRQSELVER